MTAFNTTGGIHEVPVDAAPGRLWLCGKHVIAPAPESLLAMLGADTVVCLTRRHELEHRYPGYVRWLDAAPPSRAVWFPVHDLSAPEVDRALPVLDDLAAGAEIHRDHGHARGIGLGQDQAEPFRDRVQVQ